MGTTAYLGTQEVNIAMLSQGNGQNANIDITIDTEFDTTSENPLQNKVIAEKFDTLSNELATSISTLTELINNNIQAIQTLTQKVETLEGYHKSNEGILDDLEDLFN